jgi:hypothetical protein
MKRVLRVGAWRTWAMLVMAVELAWLQGCVHAPSPATMPAHRSLAERVAAEGVVEVPLVIQHGYPFTPGEVNGRRGYFMIDNGSPFRFFLNSQYAPVTVGPEVGRGRAGSGQLVVVRRGLGVTSLSLGPDAAREVRSEAPASGEGIMAADFGFIDANVRSQFLGFLGDPWLRDFAFSLRYAPPRWLLADAADGAQRLLQGSERVALIQFEGREGSLPFATLQVGGMELRGRFDTGTPGVLELTPELKSRLERAGALRCGEAPDGGTERPGSGRVLQCRLQALRYGTVTLDIDPLNTSIGEVSRITLGTALLRRHVSVWNLRASTLDLRRETGR